MPVYLCAVCADWLQGPYKYAVYSAYGYDQRAISFLFVAGFGSGMSLGSIIGGLADSVGRKRMVCWYCVTYALSCLAKHLRPFWALLLGRVLGGHRDVPALLCLRCMVDSRPRRPRDRRFLFEPEFLRGQLRQQPRGHPRWARREHGGRHDGRRRTKELAPTHV